MEELRLEFNPITAILTILEHYNIPPKRMEVVLSPRSSSNSTARKRFSTCATADSVAASPSRPWRKSSRR
jgi:hypothetical protein